MCPLSSVQRRYRPPKVLIPLRRLDQERARAHRLEVQQNCQYRQALVGLHRKALAPALLKSDLAHDWHRHFPEIQVISSQRKGIKPRDTILNRSWR